MKNKKMKMLLSAVLAVMMVISLIPAFAFAADGVKELNEIAVTTKKPQPGNSFDAPDDSINKDFKIKSAKKSMFKVVETDYFTITEEGIGDFVPTFWGGETYLLTFKIDVSEKYAIPEDLGKIKLKIDYANAEDVELGAKNYRAPDKFKLEAGTYTIKFVEEPRAIGAERIGDLEIKYAFKIDTEELPQLVFSSKFPTAGDDYINATAPDGVAPEYNIKLVEDAGFIAAKNGWLIYEGDNKAHFDNKIRAGETYIMAVALWFNPRFGMYELPEDLADVNIKIDFTNADDVVLTKDQYRAGKDFKFEPGTYTFRVVEKVDAQPQYEFMYVVETPEEEKPSQKPAEDPTTKPAEPETKVPAADEKPETTVEETKEEVPNTGVTGSIAAGLVLVSMAAAGTAYITKKKKK